MVHLKDPNNPIRQIIINEKLGLWKDTFGKDIDRMFDWDLVPVPLVEDALNYTPDGQELIDPFSKEQKLEIYNQAFQLSDQTTKGNPNHNLRHHQQFVTNQHNGYNAFEQAVEEVTGTPFRFPEYQKLVAEIAGALHDCHHMGAAFLTDVPPEKRKYLPEVGNNVTMESLSAVQADYFLKQQGFNVPARLKGSFVIDATKNDPQARFGGSATPKSFDGALARAADIFLLSELYTSLKDHVDIHFIENGLTPPATRLGDLFNRVGFFYNHVGNTMDILDKASNDLADSLDIDAKSKMKLQGSLKKTKLTERLGWRAGLAHQKKQLKMLEEGDPALHGMLRSTLASAGYRVAGDDIIKER